MAAMRNNPLLTGALVAGLGAVTGPQMLKALAAKMAKIPAYDTHRVERLQNLISRLEPHADEATEAWKMVGGSGPTKLKYLGSGVDATTFQVTPSNTILKLSKPATHLGFDPHQIADTAPRDVMLPVLEHGQLGVGQDKPLSWFVQPRAHVLESFYDNARREKALMRTGQTPPNMSGVYDELSRVLQNEHPEWRITDSHSGNYGRWAGKDWVIDLGSMEHTPTRNALRHGAPAPEPPPSPQIPVRDTPITTPPGAPPLPTPPKHRGMFKDANTTDILQWAKDRAEGGSRAGVRADRAHDMLIEWLMRKKIGGGDTPLSIRDMGRELKKQGGLASHFWPVE